MNEIPNKIDQAFVSKLSDFEKEPAEKSWAFITASLGSSNSSSLKNKPSAKNILNNAYFYSGIAVLGLISTLYYFTHTNKEILKTATPNTPITVASPAESLKTDSENTNLVKSEPMEKPAITTSKIIKTQSQATEKAKNNTEEMTSKKSLEYNPALTSSIVKIKNNGKTSSFNFLHFVKEKNRKYVLEGLSDSLKVLIPPKNGKVIFDPLSQKFNYQPNPGFIGIDSFTYIIINEKGITSNKGTIKVVVEGDEKSELPNAEIDSPKASNNELPAPKKQEDSLISQNLSADSSQIPTKKLPEKKNLKS